MFSNFILFTHTFFSVFTSKTCKTRHIRSWPLHIPSNALPHRDVESASLPFFALPHKPRAVSCLVYLPIIPCVFISNKIATIPKFLSIWFDCVYTVNVGAVSMRSIWCVLVVLLRYRRGGGSGPSIMVFDTWISAYVANRVSRYFWRDTHKWVYK